MKWTNTAENIWNATTPDMKDPQEVVTWAVNPGMVSSQELVETATEAGSSSPENTSNSTNNPEETYSGNPLDMWSSPHVQNIPQEEPSEVEQQANRDTDGDGVDDTIDGGSGIDGWADGLTGIDEAWARQFDNQKGGGIADTDTAAEVGNNVADTAAGFGDWLAGDLDEMIGQNSKIIMVGGAAVLLGGGFLYYKTVSMV